MSNKDKVSKERHKPNTDVYESSRKCTRLFRNEETNGMRWKLGNARFLVSSWQIFLDRVDI